MKIGIFGGGAISPHLEKYLVKKTNYQIVCYDRSKLNVTNYESVSNIIKENQFDVLFSLAALSNIPDSFNLPLEYYRVNCSSTLNILEAIRRFSPQTKLVVSGSIQELSNSNPYSGSKNCSRNTIINYRKSFGLWCCQPLLSNILVDRASDNFVVPKIVNFFKKGDFSTPLELGNVFSSKKWLDISDLTEALWGLACLEKPYDLILSGEEQVSVKNLVEFAAQSVGLDGKWEILAENHVFMDKDRVYVRNNPLNSRPNENIEYDIEETKKILGWEPRISVKKSIEKLIK